MTNWPRRRGFTLVEMLVVIAVIVVLMAILFPVFSRVRAHANKVKCIAHLEQIAIALRKYSEDYNGRFPPPPVFVNGRYEGGISALYPDYIDNMELFACPVDVDARRAQARQVRYSSYNGKATNAGNGTWALSEVYYNYNGYTFSGPPGGPIDSTGLDNGGTNDAGYKAAVMSEYGPEGLHQRDLPRLANRTAPGNTIITHCGRHSDDAEVILRLDGTAEGNAKRGRMEQDPDGNGPKVAPYLGQRK
ncbi:MAG: prepilin-type N-terminal cleavage/methylation domain-containing protein [Armatimonadetes bacterium]|nr:prepilin-type N-terminal cleavage/methylation domain-containing protein [Armatimonadota bacterium]